MILFIVIISTLFTACGNSVSNKQMTLDLSYGQRSGTYSGEVNKDGLPNGKGKFESQNPEGQKWIYDGEFKNGHFEGQGTNIIIATKQKEMGTFSNDELNGQGKLYLNDQLYYEGNFENGLPMLDSVGLNEEVSFADWKYKVISVDKQNSIGNKQAKGQFFIVSIDVTNNAQRPREIGAKFFALADDKGKLFPMDGEAMLADKSQSTHQGNRNASWYLSDINPSLSEYNMKIIFDIPKDSNKLKFIPAEGLGKVAPVLVQDRQ